MQDRIESKNKQEQKKEQPRKTIRRDQIKREPPYHLLESNPHKARIALLVLLDFVLREQVEPLNQQANQAAWPDNRKIDAVENKDERPEIGLQTHRDKRKTTHQAGESKNNKSTLMFESWNKRISDPPLKYHE